MATSAIKTPPEKVGDFGLEFDYSAWTPGTVVNLCNVNWDNQYRDVVLFGNDGDSPSQRKEALNAHIDSLETPETRIDQMMYHKPGAPVRIKMPYNKALRYNYLRAHNPAQPGKPNDVSRDFYYFILAVNYVARDTTELVLQLDVFQSFFYDVQLGQAFIERGHIGIANANQFDAFGRDFLSVPEGRDVGGEYRVVAKRSNELMRVNNSFNHNVLVVSTADLNADPGSLSDPKVETAEGSTFEHLVSGASYYLFETATTFQNYMILMKTKPWITSCIVSITLVPDVRRYSPDFSFGESGFVEASGYIPVPIKHKMFENWRDSQEVLNRIPAKFRHLKKFFTFPYMALELTTWTGTPIILKPESWADKDATIIERSTLTPPNQRVEYTPRRYNADPDSEIDWLIPELKPEPGTLPEEVYEALRERFEVGDDRGEFLDITTKIANFPTMAVVNNAALGYLASNAHGIAYQYSANHWSQQRALSGNQLSYDNASSGIDLANEQTRLGINNNKAEVALANQIGNEQTELNAINGMVMGPATGAAAGLASGMGPKGVALGAVGGVASGVGQAAMGGVQNMQNKSARTRQGALSQGQMKATNAASQETAASVRDANKRVSDWAARGDYANQVDAIYARVQDAQLAQPTTSGQVGGEAMNLVNANMEVSLRIKMIDKANMEAIGNFWLRYGYSVLRWQVINRVSVMTKFSYWKLTETYLIASGMPEGFKSIIRGIFEKGVTVWNRPEYIGLTDLADNQAKEGVTLS